MTKIKCFRTLANCLYLLKNCIVLLNELTSGGESYVPVPSALLIQIAVYTL